MEFFQILWYLVLLSVAAAVPIPQHIQMNQILGWTAVAISACFGIHDQAFIVVRVLGSLLYHAWDEARMVCSKGISIPDAIDSNDEDAVQDSEVPLRRSAQPKRFPGEFSVPDDTNSDDEGAAQDPKILAQIAHAEGQQAHLDEMFRKNRELSKYNEALLADNDKLAKTCDRLEVENKRLSGANDDLDIQTKNHEIESRVALAQEKTEQAVRIVFEKDQEIVALNSKLVQQDFVIKKYQTCHYETEKREKEKDEKIEGYHCFAQSTKEKLHTLDMILKTLHDMAKQGRKSFEPAIYMMDQLLRAGVTPRHLEIDLGRFAYYLTYFRLGWSNRGTLVGGFRATMAMILGRTSYNQLIFVHRETASQEVLPLAFIDNLQNLDLACQELELRYLASTNICGPAFPVYHSDLVFSGNSDGPTSPVDTSGTPINEVMGKLTFDYSKDVAHSQPTTKSWPITKYDWATTGDLTGVTSASLKYLKKKRKQETKKWATKIHGTTKTSGGTDQGISIKGAANRAPAASPANIFSKHMNNNSNVPGLVNSQTDAPAASSFTDSPFGKTMNKVGTAPGSGNNSVLNLNIQSTATPPNRSANLGVWSAPTTSAPTTSAPTAPSSVPLAGVPRSGPTSFVMGGAFPTTANQSSSSRSYRSQDRDGDTEML
jgi:hypothetical protein